MRFRPILYKHNFVVPSFSQYWSAYTDLSEF
uniref:Uncharacterized protein n=1 Tax=Arundo donax TaxID=35708 RepID=A0A0A9B1P2_ARUDO